MAGRIHLLGMMVGALPWVVGACTNDLEFEDIQGGSGGAANDGGAPGAGGSPTVEDCAGEPVCEGFETDAGAFVLEEMLGTAELSQERSRSGTTALRSTTPGDGAWGQATFAFSPIGEGKAYFRAHYFIVGGSVSGRLNLFTIGQPDAESEVDVDVLASGAAEVFYHSSADRYESEPGVFPEDRWFCLQGELDVSATQGQLQVWIEGAPVLTTPATHNTFFPPGYSEIWVGIHWTEDGQGPAEVFTDDVALSTSPLDC